MFVNDSNFSPIWARRQFKYFSVCVIHQNHGTIFKRLGRMKSESEKGKVWCLKRKKLKCERKSGERKIKRNTFMVTLAMMILIWSWSLLRFSTKSKVVVMAWLGPVFLLAFLLLSSHRDHLFQHRWRTPFWRPSRWWGRWFKWKCWCWMGIV